MSNWKRPDSGPGPARLSDMSAEERYDTVRDLTSALAQQFASQIIATVREHGGGPADGMVATLRASHDLLLMAVAMQVEYAHDLDTARSFTVKVLREWITDIESLRPPDAEAPLPPRVVQVLEALGIDPATARIMLDDSGSMLVSADTPRRKS
jgi:hypothetical protein